MSSWDRKCLAAPGDTAQKVPVWGGEGSKEGTGSTEGMLHIPGGINLGSALVRLSLQPV